MKLTLRHLGVRSTDVLDTWIENEILALQDVLRIDEATIRLERRAEGSPAYEVHVHLVTPGPDVFAEAQDHTVRAAFTKVMDRLRARIADRSTRRQERVRSQAPGMTGAPMTHR